MKIQATVTPAIGGSLLAEINRTVSADISLQVGDGGVAFNGMNANEFFEADGVAVNATVKLKNFDVLLKKATQGDVQAQFEVGEMYYYGIGTKVDQPKAIEWYAKAAGKEHAAAQAQLAWAYFYGSSTFGILKDLTKAISLFQKSAAKGDVYALLGLEVAYRNGQGVNRDEKEAQRYFDNAMPALEKLAQQGDHLAQYWMGQVNRKDHAKAFGWYEKSALQGNVQAQWDVGSFYQLGFGVPKNDVKAFEWYEKSALQGYVFSQFSLGNCYLKGRGVPKNDAKALEWFEKAALQGDASAQSELGDFYKEGWGVPKNYAKALEWYKKAALQGDAHARVWVQEFYKQGWGFLRNDAKSFEWFEKIALQGDAWAQSFVGECYLNGWGIKKDLVLAYVWLNLASVDSSQDWANWSKKARDGIQLSSSERAEADRLSFGWKKGQSFKRVEKKTGSVVPPRELDRGVVSVTKSSSSKLDAFIQTLK
jgi:TPR repeat protein